MTTTIYQVSTMRSVWVFYIHLYSQTSAQSNISPILQINKLTIRQVNQVYTSVKWWSWD